MPLASGKRLTLRQSAPEMPIYVERGSLEDQHRFEQPAR
jgi:hypothetical protein